MGQVVGDQAQLFPVGPVEPTPVERELAPPGDTDSEVAQLGSACLAEAFLDDEAALEGETPG